jgi:hypothetical protein
MICSNCGGEADRLYPDQRAPPQKKGMLCAGCFDDACDYAIEVLEDEVQRISDYQTAVRETQCNGPRQKPI